MVRTQLYLPDTLYYLAKKRAKKTKTSFADVVRLSLERDLISKPFMSLNDLKARFPILKFAGIVKGSLNNADNDNIDNFLYGTEQEK